MDLCGSSFIIVPFIELHPVMCHGKYSFYSYLWGKYAVHFSMHDIFSRPTQNSQQLSGSTLKYCDGVGVAQKFLETQNA